MRKFFVLIILLISSLAYGQDAWKVCFFSISHDGKNTSDIVSRAVKSSVSGFLKRDFVLIDITNTTAILSKDDAYLIALSNGVEFAIFGYVSQQEQRMELVLELIDVANKLVKLSKSYDFFYDVDEIFNTIDTIVVDFTEGIKKVIPKYEETAVVEYREKIKQQQEKLEIPGTFTPSVYLSMQLMPFEDERIISLYPEISLKYQTTKGSLFGNGWFIGLNSILSFSAVNSATTNVNNLGSSPMGAKINLYSGINITDWLGIGIDMILFKEIDIIDYEQQGDRNILHISDRSIDMAFTPMIKFSFGNLDIPLFILVMSRDFQSFITPNAEGIKKDFQSFSMTSIEMRPLYKISKTLNIEAKIGIDILTYPLNLPGNTQPIEATFINPSLGISVSRSFSF